LTINSLGELAEIFEKELNQKIAKRIVKDKNKDFDKGLAKAIVKRWNQTLNNENLKEFNKLIKQRKEK
jgi:hypothetical protein